MGTLEFIFKDIWTHDGAEKEKLRPYQNKFQKIMFFSMIGCFFIALLVAISTKICGPYNWQKITGLGLVALSQLSAILYQLSFVFEGLKIFKEPTRNFLEPITKSAARDYKLATSMSRFQVSQLNYAKHRLTLESEQMKKRVGILVGAIDKVGIMPVAVTWGLAAYKYFSDNKLQFSEVDWLAYGLMAIYSSSSYINFYS